MRRTRKWRSYSDLAEISTNFLADLAVPARNRSKSGARKNLSQQCLPVISANEREIGTNRVLAFTEKTDPKHGHEAST
jgi:hypothetical protein